MPSGSKGEHGIERRIDTFLGEFRMVVPGVAALFGFQLAVTFSEAFQEALPFEKRLNFAGLACSALAIVFLLVPANYHRFIHRLRETEDFMRYAKRSIAVAFVFLPLSLACSLAMQASTTFGSWRAGAAVFAFFLVAAALAWWLVPWLRARAQGEEEKPKG